MARIGPDISHHQQQVDLARAKPHVHFMFLKATDGTGFVDKTFATRWQKLAQLGIPRGAYHFARPGDASAQAAHFIKVAKQNGFRAGDVAIIDVEDPSDDPDAWVGTSAAALRALIDRYIKDVRQGLPVENVVFYTGLPFWRDRLGSPAKLPANSIGWLCRYRKEGPYGGSLPRPAAWPNPPDIWQFTDGVAGNTRDIQGIGKVDTNEMTEACFLRLFEVGLVAPVPAFTGTLKPGDRDARVEQVQRNLNRFLPPTGQLTVNGHFDAATKETLTKWQTNRRIPAASIGVVGPGTWEMLFAPRFSQDLKLGSKGRAVRQLKFALNKFPGNQLDTNNEEFKEDTRKAVRNWQDHRGQRIDGIVDLLTWYWIHAPSVKQVPDLHPG
jgi:GH25 family lysozyme M1 (1,4-beta-N-acetylmuramidase)